MRPVDSLPSITIDQGHAKCRSIITSSGLTVSSFSDSILGNWLLLLNLSTATRGMLPLAVMTPWYWWVLVLPIGIVANFVISNVDIAPDEYIFAKTVDVMVRNPQI